MTPLQIIPALVTVATAATLLAGCGGSDSNAGSPPKPTTAPAKSAGSYPYHCSIHPFVKATIVVG